MGNHLVSDSAATINAGASDDEMEGMEGIARPTTSQLRSTEETDIYDDDDIESLASMPVGGANGQPLMKAEEEVRTSLRGNAREAFTDWFSATGRATRACLCLLWHPQRRQCRQVPCLQQVVL